MACNPAVATLFAAALLLFAATSPSGKADAQLLNGLLVGGRICCSAEGNCRAGTQGIAGVGVRLNCTLLGGSTTVGIGTTDATGAYNITVPALPGLLLGLPALPCTVSVRLPLEAAVCPLFSTTTGLLVGTLSVVGTVVNAVLGLIQSAVVTSYIRVGL